MIHTLANFFAIANAIIALCYGLLAVFFARRTHLPAKKDRSRWALIACVGAATFFTGCAYTYITLALWALTDQLSPHWFDWWNVLAFSVQSIGGIVFWYCATFYIQLNVFDKHHYEQTTFIEEKDK